MCYVTHAEMKTLNACKAGFKQYQVLVHHEFASRSDANESLEHEVVNVLNTLKSGNPTHTQTTSHHKSGDEVPVWQVHACRQ